MADNEHGLHIKGSHIVGVLMGLLTLALAAFAGKVIENASRLNTLDALVTYRLGQLDRGLADVRKSVDDITNEVNRARWQQQQSQGQR